MDDTAVRQARLAGWARLMQRYGVPIPDRVRQDMIPRTPPGTRPLTPTPRAQPAAEQPRPRWRGIPENAPRIGPGAEGGSRRVRVRPERVFPVKNPPTGYPS